MTTEELAAYFENEKRNRPTESVPALGLRAVVKLGRMGHNRNFTGDQLLELAHWFEGKISGETLQALIDKLEKMENEEQP
jgi:hypothetical protein